MIIKNNLDKLGVFVLIIIALAILSSGCTSKSEITTNKTAVNLPVSTITSTPTANHTTEIPKVAKLKIMSVTTEPATLGGITVIIKVKNIGDSVAKDVYAGGIKILKSQNYWNSIPLSWEKYPAKEVLINQSVHDVLINGSSRIDTGFVFTSTLFQWNNIDNGNLRHSVASLGIDWVMETKIEKIDNGNTIKLTNGTKNLLLKINNEKTKINIDIDDGRIYESSIDEFIVNNENGNLNVYYTTNTSRFNGLIVSGTLDAKDYIGDILPNETKTAQFTMTLDPEYSSRPDLFTYIKTAWIDETKEFTIY